MHSSTHCVRPSSRPLLPFLLGAVLLICASGLAPAQTTTRQTAPRPPAPPTLTPPAGNVAFLTAHAVGTQEYLCIGSPDAGTTSWMFFGPQATLSLTVFGTVQQQVLTHFLSPVPNIALNPLPACTISTEEGQINCATWQDSFDSSEVWGSRLTSVVAGTDAACPNNGAIPCLLLRAVQTRPGTYGPGLLSRTTYIQRLNTVGGAAPAGACRAGDEALVPYEADYTFLAPTRNSR